MFLKYELATANFLFLLFVVEFICFGFGPKGMFASCFNIVVQSYVEILTDANCKRVNCVVP